MKLEWPDQAELEAEANRRRPIPIPFNGQCLRDAVAQVLRIPAEQLPPRRWGEPIAEWLATVTLEHGTFFEPTKAKDLPPASGPWVAIVETDQPHVSHAVAMIGRTSSDLDYPRAAEHAIAGLVPEAWEG